MYNNHKANTLHVKQKKKLGMRCKPWRLLIYLNYTRKPRILKVRNSFTSVWPFLDRNHVNIYIYIYIYKIIKTRKREERKSSFCHLRKTSSYRFSYVHHIQRHMTNRFYNTPEPLKKKIKIHGKRWRTV